VLGWAGTGGMALVYRCEHAETSDWVALKVIRRQCASDERARARFEREIEIMKRLAHCDDVVHWRGDGLLPDGRRYLFMGWAPGETLHEILEDYRNNDERLDPWAALEIARDLAKTLVLLHHTGVVHRDITPRNLMVDRKRTARLLTPTDFA